MNNSTTDLGGSLGITGLEYVLIGLEGAILLALVIVYIFALAFECSRVPAKSYVEMADEDSEDEDTPSQMLWETFFFTIGVYRYSAVVLLMWRVLALIYGIVVFVWWYIVTYSSAGRGFDQFMGYMSNLNFLAFVVFYLLSAGTTVLYLSFRCFRCRAERRSWILKVWALPTLTWVTSTLFDLKFVTSICVTTIAWLSFVGALLGYPAKPPSLIGFLTHGGNTLIFVIEFLFMDGYMALSTILLAPMIPLLYYLYLLVFTATGSLKQYPYELLLDPAKGLGAWTIAVRLGVALGWLVTYFVVFMAWVAKNYAIRKFCIKGSRKRRVLID